MEYRGLYQYPIFYYILQPQMQNRSVDITPFESTPPKVLPLPTHPSHLELMPVNTLKSTLADIIPSLLQNHNPRPLRLVLPQLHHPLRQALLRLAPDLPYKVLPKGPFNSHKLSKHQKSNQGRQRIGSNLQLLEGVVFGSNQHQFLSHVDFDLPLLQHPLKLLDSLCSNVPNKERKLMAEALASAKATHPFIVSLPHPKSRDELEHGLINFLRDSLLIKLRESYLEIEGSRMPTEQQQQQLRLTKDYSLFWRCLQKPHKLSILLLTCKDIEALCYHLSTQKLPLSCAELEQQLDHLLKADSTEFYHHIFTCKYRQLLSPLTEYHRLVYLAVRKEMEGGKRKKEARQSRIDRDYNSEQKKEQKDSLGGAGKKKTNKLRKSISVESNETNYTEHQRQLHLHGQQRHLVKEYEAEYSKPELYHHRGAERSEEHERRVALYSGKREERSIKSNKNKGRLEKSRRDERNGEERERVKHEKSVEKEKEEGEGEVYKQNSISSQKTFSSEYSHSIPPPLLLSSPSPTTTPTPTPTPSLAPIPTPAVLLTPSQLHQATCPKLADQLSQICDWISQQANQYYQRRIIAFERIQFLLQYYSIPIKLFGSCANGIAVKNSDIDIAIDQSILYWMEFVPEGEKVGMALEKVQELFMSYPCFMDIKLIKTAAIPVMKLTIDTSIPFISEEYVTYNRLHNAGPIQADLTIQTTNLNNQSSHLGIQTTNAISQWLAQITTLHKIVIIMKQFFTVNGLNLAYEGGLNTISMIVMFVACVKAEQLEAEENDAVVLERILRFYGEEFLEKEMGIDLMMTHAEGIFYHKGEYGSDHCQLQKADLEIRDPICQSKNMTRNCYLYPEIKKMFKNILQNCFRRSQADLSSFLQSHPEQLAPIPQLAPRTADLNSQAFAQRNVFLQLHQHTQLKSQAL